MLDIPKSRLLHGNLTFAGNERDELADTLLHALFRLLGNLSVLRERRLHDPGHWCKVANVSIVDIVLDGLGGRRGAAGRLRRVGRRLARH